MNSLPIGLIHRILCAAVVALYALPSLAADPLIPDPKLTPGAWNSPATQLRTLCAVGYTKTVRNTPDGLKRRVFLSYGLDPDRIVRGNYEIDHLVSLELDGTNAAANLWPQSYRTTPLNARRKDVLENTLKRLVCSGKLPLATAQQAIARDWVGAYRRYVKGN